MKKGGKKKYNKGIKLRKERKIKHEKNGREEMFSTIIVKEKESNSEVLEEQRGKKWTKI